MPSLTKPTATAAAGKFLSHGEDFIQFSGSNGELVHRVDKDGKIYAAGIDIVEAIQNLEGQIISSLPSTVDAGTF